MYRGRRIVCVTPAGRRRYMRVLVPYILRSPLVDEYQIWANTTDLADLAFIHRLAALDPRVRVIDPPETSVDGNKSIGQFFRFCIDPGSIYIRFDDDIVWMNEDFFEVLLDFRIANPDYFIVSPLIINNAICSYALQARNQLNSVFGSLTPYAFDATGWKSPHFAHHLHNLLLHHVAVGDLEPLMFDRQEMGLGRYSINCISWLGEEFARFGGRVPPEAEEEEWISAWRPAASGRTNCIFGGAVASHFAFFPQRAYLDATNLLARYADLCRDTVGSDPQRCPDEVLALLPPPCGGFRRCPGYEPQMAARIEALIGQGQAWQYWRSDGKLICPALVLLPGGAIGNYRHPNESRWEFRQGRLCFLHRGGQVSTRFHSLEADGRGRLRAIGTFLFDTVQFHHVLMPADAVVSPASPGGPAPPPR
jgi:hypothetical protein